MTPTDPKPRALEWLAKWPNPSNQTIIAPIDSAIVRDLVARIDELERRECYGDMDACVCAVHLRGARDRG